MKLSASFPNLIFLDYYIWSYVKSKANEHFFSIGTRHPESYGKNLAIASVLNEPLAKKSKMFFLCFNQRDFARYLF